MVKDFLHKTLAVQKELQNDSLVAASSLNTLCSCLLFLSCLEDNVGGEPKKTGRSPTKTPPTSDPRVDERLETLFVSAPLFPVVLECDLPAPRLVQDQTRDTRHRKALVGTNVIAYQSYQVVTAEKDPRQIREKHLACVFEGCLDNHMEEFSCGAREKEIMRRLAAKAGVVDYFESRFIRCEHVSQDALSIFPMSRSRELVTYNHNELRMQWSKLEASDEIAAIDSEYWPRWNIDFREQSLMTSAKEYQDACKTLD